MLEKLNQILNLTNDVIIEFDENGTYLNIWTSSDEFLTIPKDEKIGKRTKDVLPHDRSEYLLAKISEVIKTQSRVKLNYKQETPSGVKYFKGSMLPLNFDKQTTFVMYVKNITTERYKDYTSNNIQKLAKMGSWELEVSTRKKSCSQQTYEIYELESHQETDLSTFINLYDEKSKILIQKALKICISDREACDVELCLDKTKTKKFVRVTGYPIFDHNNKVVRIAGLMHDITEHIKLNAAFKVQQVRLSRIIEQAPGVFFEFKRAFDGTFSLPYISPNVQKILGYKPSEVMDGSDSFIKQIHIEDLPRWISALEKSVKELCDFSWKGRIRADDGEFRWIVCQSTPKALPNQDIIWDGLMFDITTKQIEEEILKEKQKSVNHQLKLASLGELAAGVAHEINNPLAIFNNVLEQIGNQVKKNSFKPENLEALIGYAFDASKRIERITKGLKTFSRADVQKKEKFDITKAFKTTVELISELNRSKNIKFNYDFENKECLLFGNRGRLDQVLMNLVSNAKDAVANQKEGKISMKLLCDEKNCHITIKDNGPGIPKNIANKIFDPFFSTKDVDRGTGIGLSIANSIVQEHSGNIDLKTSSEGSSFIVEIPRTQNREV